MKDNDKKKILKGLDIFKHIKDTVDKLKNNKNVIDKSE